MKKILICDHFSKQTYTGLQDKGYEVLQAKSLTPTQNEIKEVHGLLIRSRTVIDQTLLDSAKKLKLILSATAGFDHIDYKICQERNICVMHTPLANVQSATELTLALMLSQLRSMTQVHTNLVQTKAWRDQAPRGHTLHNKSVGIVGLGRIGMTVANLCKAFGANVLYYDPYVNSNEFKKVTEFKELLKQSKIVSLHVPLTQKTKKLIGCEELNLMTKNGLLVNCSRGEVIDQKALVDFMNIHSEFKVALDVFNQEPCKDTKLLGLDPQFLGTPHIGAYTHEALENASSEAVQKLLNFFEFEQISDPVPPHAAWTKDL
ncbi:MAG: hypothetical protein MK008_05110 [Bdellovibrionales bacterium]|nr:hypothetical protein [Bdellovibrionales bacterium]